MKWGTIEVSRIKKWLYERFLPAWCRDDLMEANKRLRERVDKQAQEIERLNAYIDGMQDAMIRSRVIIKAGKVDAK